MFVSGPVGTRVIRPSRARIWSAMNETACCATGPPRGRGQLGAVEARLAVDVRGDISGADERAVRAGRDRDVAAAYELEHAKRVGRRLLERRVARHGRHADELDLGRSQAEQERDRVVVPRIAIEDDRRQFSHASTFAISGSDPCPPGVAAANAPTAHARRRDSW